MGQPQLPNWCILYIVWVVNCFYIVYWVSCGFVYKQVKMGSLGSRHELGKNKNCLELVSVDYILFGWLLEKGKIRLKWPNSAFSVTELCTCPCLVHLLILNLPVLQTNAILLFCRELFVRYWVENCLKTTFSWALGAVCCAVKTPCFQESFLILFNSLEASS